MDGDKAGYYWVKFESGRWAIGERYTDSTWCFVGNDTPFFAEDMTKWQIGPRIMPPNL